MEIYELVHTIFREPEVKNTLMLTRTLLRSWADAGAAVKAAAKAAESFFLSKSGHGPVWPGSTTPPPEV